MTFDELGLNADLLKAIHEAGYETPTPIQAQAIPPALQNRDVLGIAQTGTGKTASFTLPMIEKLSKGRARARMPRSLILTPTRELAAQVAENFEKYGKYQKLTMALLIGGVSFADQLKKLDRGVDVLIATPGRLLDHFERGKLMLTGVQTFVIDEADRMLDMGFIPDIERICGLIPFTRQTLLFSATMPPEIERLADKFLQAPERIEVARRSSTAETVTQHVVRTGKREKSKTLRDLIAGEEAMKNAIIFCNRKRDVDVVARALKKAGMDASPIHGDLDQSVRTRTLDAFRDGTLKLLVASDVAARGLDIPDVSHVFNYDVPTHSEDYVHRIGRTGRAGREGSAFTLVTPDDKKYLDAIEKLIGKSIDELKPANDDQPVEEPKADTAAPSEGASEVEGEAVAAETDSGEETPKKPRRRRGGRGRGRKSDAKQAETAEASDTEEAATEDTSNETSDETEADETPRRSSRRGKRGGDKSRGGRNNNGGGERIVGMGDHVPAFILRPVRFASKTAASDEAEEPSNEADADSGSERESDAA